METAVYKNLTQTRLADIRELLRGGELVAFPTETVYGLGALFSHEAGIQGVYRVKGRPADNPLIVHVSSSAMMQSLIAPSKLQERRLEALAPFFPGPLTVVLPAPPALQGRPGLQGGTIAIRMPSHPIAMSLIAFLQEPLVAPSANLSGRPSPTSAGAVLEDLEGKIPLLLDGGVCTIGLESTVLDLSSSDPQVLRPGSITCEMLSTALGCTVPLVRKPSSLSPGGRYPHYAPKACVVLFTSLDEVRAFDQESTLFLSYREPVLAGFEGFRKKNLYALFRKADKMNKKTVAIYVDGAVLRDDALMNRITKAAQSG
ncbi:MAG: L-threonylcarbamoyladenylate synthase [Chlamydiota bacterium]